MMALATGAYSLTILTPDALFAVRDPFGLRPLFQAGATTTGWSLPRVARSTPSAPSWCATCSRRDPAHRRIRLRSDLMENPPRPARLRLRANLLARPDSVLDGQTAFEARVAMGRELAKEHPAQADLVIGVPDSGVPAAIGYAQEMGLPLSEGLIKNRYVGRTFIQPISTLARPASGSSSTATRRGEREGGRHRRRQHRARQHHASNRRSPPSWWRHGRPPAYLGAADSPPLPLGDPYASARVCFAHASGPGGNPAVTSAPTRLAISVSMVLHAAGNATAASAASRATTWCPSTPRPPRTRWRSRRSLVAAPPPR